MWRETIECAFVDPDAFHERDAAGWDGVLLSKVVICPRCEAEDRYRLVGDAYLKLTLQLLRSLAEEPGARVIVGATQTWDGSLVRRVSEGIARLKSWTEREPDNGESWRRLGNFLERFGRPGEAKCAWHQAIDVDEGELEAAYSLAKRADNERDWPAFEGALQVVLGRLPRAEAEPRQIIAMATAHLLGAASTYGAPRALEAAWSVGQTGGREVVVHHSSVALTHIKDAGAVADFLASPKLVSARLASEIPGDEEPTLLECALDGIRDLRSLPASTLTERRDRSPKRARTKRKNKSRLARASRKKNR